MEAVADRGTDKEEKKKIQKNAKAISISSLRYLARLNHSQQSEVILCCFGLLQNDFYMRVEARKSGRRFLFRPQARSTFLRIPHQRSLKWFEVT